MKRTPILLLLSLFLAIPGTAADGGPSSSDYCRAIVRFALNPVGTLGKKALEIVTRKKLDFNEELYWAKRAEIRKNPSLLKQDLDPVGADWGEIETLFAHLDAQTESLGMPVTVVQKLGQSDADAARFIEAFRSVYRGTIENGGAREAAIDRLTLLYYGISRGLPFDVIEPLFKSPSAIYRDITPLEVDRLILKHSIYEVFKRFGLSGNPREPTFLGRVWKGLFVAGNVGLKAIGWVGDPTLITELAFNKRFYDDVLLLGNAKATKKWAPVIEGKIGNRTKVEVFLAASGAAFSGYMSYAMVDRYLRSNPGKRAEPKSKEISEAELRAYLRERWTTKHPDEEGNVALSEAERAAAVRGIESLDLARLDRAYRKALREAAPSID